MSSEPPYSLKKYDIITIIDHKLFNNQYGKSVLFKNINNGYSEAFAGSGESLIAVMINSIFNAPNNSLILLDEPETSLHPAAQLKLRDFLIKSIETKHHQVVISTHSPVFVEALPPFAVKILFHSNEHNNKIFVRNSTHPPEAFNILAHLRQTEKNKLYYQYVIKSKIFYSPQGTFLRNLYAKNATMTNFFSASPYIERLLHSVVPPISRDWIKATRVPTQT